MISRVEVWFRWLRRSLSRSHWFTHLLRLPVSKGSGVRSGLIMIQIDGLAQPQLQQALKRGKMPFLQRLLQRENYKLQAHYSGLPATTPAVQAELFYGVKTAVPAFSFRDRQTGEIVRMLQPDTAAKVEQGLRQQSHAALLQDGSAYSNIYTGGAAESHFCAATMGWGAALRAANPLVLLGLFISNLYSVLRIIGLFFLELGLAIVDFCRGIIKGQDFLSELKFIPARVAVSIVLRELCVIGGKMDISRGLPVVHINLLGYDEQSHRRGPSSLFAHWTLKGIDDSIARLWRSAHRSQWRSYQVWLYSDHGQAKVTPYHVMQGYPLQQAVDASFEKLNSLPAGLQRKVTGSVQTQRARLLGGRKVQRMFSVNISDDQMGADNQIKVAAQGPVGHIYTGLPLSEADSALLATELAAKHKVPLVLVVAGPDRLRATTADGTFYLPEDKAAIFGNDHPFLDSVAKDILRLCQHPDAGELVIMGWRKGVKAQSFADENGAHAGATPAETHGFAMLPEDVTLPDTPYGYIRPSDIYHAALQQLGRRSSKPAGRTASSPERCDSLRVMTYNVHSCIGLDGKIDVERIARVIALAKPDVVVLQELDVGRDRTQGLDQAQLIARQLEMEFHFHPAMHLEEEKYGDAILTHLPLTLVKAGPLPGLADKPKLEPRGAIWATIELHGQQINIINTHLGLQPRERLAQIDALLGEEWLGHPDCAGPVIFCGDLNAQPGSEVCRRLNQKMTDAQTLLEGYRPRGTFPSRFAAIRIDHIYVSEAVEVTAVEIPGSQQAKIASDHLPLLIALAIPRSQTVAEKPA
ncbi:MULTISPECIES: endonuclease/exonuclease/phosphatase family protein [unclassified Arsukibacterium]|uniref:endonuclease/exonuclease/phosphatase family protein n=1 Tax=unclassified Arsukibacterium TaxID=2635278 RepID=UPI0025C2B5CC|nr:MULTISPECIES: endonuclease/exonuclease/phosphatase family protein [unclassified Arsukibacterium]|tara:strand:+ start:20851 stop:23277 length:2427 start_codon:yes stop_codon:yes gene_type:complete